MNWEKGRQLESMTDGTDTLSFKYDNGGIRTSKTVNGTQTKYTYIGTTLVSQKTGAETMNFAYTAGGAPYGFTYNGVSYFYLLNLQGDVIGIYDGNGNIVVQYTYDSWGKLVSVTGSLADTVGVKNPLRYRGYYYDAETGLYYLQSRYYDPDTCRFINADSLLVAGDYIQGTNMFAYCLNNPVMYVDPSGREAHVEEALSFVLGLVCGLIYLEEHMPLMDLDLFMRDVANAGLSGMEVVDTILSLCLLVSEGALEDVNRSDYFVMAKKSSNTKGSGNWVDRNGRRHGSENRQKTGARERNIGHKKGEEHSIKPKGNGAHIPKAVSTGIAVVGVIVTGAAAVTEALVFFGRTMAFGLV